MNADKEIFKDLYKDVSDWLKFAEAKNAALLTLNGAIMFGLLRVASSDENFEALGNLIYCASFLLFINIIINMISFIPILNLNRRIKKNKHTDFSYEINYLFYGDIKNHSPSSLLKAMKFKYKAEFNEKDHFYLDYALQIIAVSSLAWRKNKFFNFSCYMDIVILLIIIMKIITMKIV